MEQAGQHMEKTFKQFQKQDEFISCESLLSRWASVSRHTILEATQADILIPFRYTKDICGNTIKEILSKTTLSLKPASIAEDESRDEIDMLDASKRGIVFSLANVLLLENKYPDIFVNTETTNNTQNSNELALRIYKEKQQLAFDYDVLYSRYCKLFDDYKEAKANSHSSFTDLHNAKRYIGRLEEWLRAERSRNKNSNKGTQECDGQAFCKWVCDRRRQGIPDSETGEILKEKYGFTKPAAYMLITLPEEFEEEQKAAADGKPITDATRTQRFDGIVITKTNKLRKGKKM